MFFVSSRILNANLTFNKNHIFTLAAAKLKKLQKTLGHLHI